MIPPAGKIPPNRGERARSRHPSLRALRTFLLRLHLAALRRPVATLLVTLAAVLALGSRAPQLKVLLSLDGLGERGLRATATNRDLRASFQTGNELVMFFVPERPGARLAPEQVLRVRDWLATEAKSNVDLSGVVSPFVVQHLRRDGDFVAREPLLVTGSSEELDSLAASPWAGILTDRSGSDLAAQLRLRDTPGGSRYGRFDPRAVGRVEQSVRRAFPPGSGVRVHLAGPAAFEYNTLRGIQRFRWLNAAMLLMILVMLRVLLGSWRSGALFAGILLVAALSVAGGMSLCGQPIDLLSTGMFLILAVAALEDFLFLSSMQLQHGAAWRAAFRRMLVPSLLTSLTTVIGFWSLCTSRLEIVARLGLWAGVGAAIEWVVTFLVLPAFVARFASWRRWVDPARAWRPRIAEGLVGLSPPRGVALAAMVLVFASGAWGAFHLNHNDSLPRLFDSGNPGRIGFEYLDRSRGYQGFVHLVLPRPDDRAANEALLARAAAVPGVAQVLSPYTVFDEALGASGLLPSEVEEVNPESMRKLRGFFSADGHVRAIAYLRHVESDSLRAPLASLDSVCRPAGGYVAGELVTYREFNERVPATLYSSLGTCLLLVAALIAGLMTLMGVGGRGVVLAASFWGVSAMLTGLWISRVPLSFLTCGFASVLVGLTGDNIVQYLFASPGGRLGAGIRARGLASIQVSVLMALASLAFLGSAFLPSRRLGVLLAMGFLAALAGDLWLLKALWREPRTEAR